MSSWSADIQAQINIAQTYQHETVTFLKYCEHYIVGYSTHGVQIIKGKCHYGGIRDLGVNVGGHYPGDLPAWIGGVVFQNLPAEIIGIPATQEVELPAYIAAHPPEDLSAYIDTHDPEDLSAYIRGFDYRDLSASTYILQSQNLPAVIGAHLPEDLSGYIKPWPERDLPGYIYGWDTKDLGGYIKPGGYTDLPAIIGTHRPKNIKALIKGWVREATYDLSAVIRGFALPVDLSASINPTEMAQLPAYLFAIAPKDLIGNIHGWDTKDLQGIINIIQYPWNLPASINVTGGFRELPADIFGRKFDPLPTDLTAFIYPTKGRIDLSAMVLINQARNLPAYIDTGRDIGNLIAEIYPKIIRLTGIISMITMQLVYLVSTLILRIWHPIYGRYINPI